MALTRMCVYVCYVCVSVCLCVIECESTGVALFVVNVDKTFRNTRHVYVGHIQMHRQ